MQLQLSRRLPLLLAVGASACLACGDAPAGPELHTTQAVAGRVTYCSDGAPPVGDVIVELRTGGISYVDTTDARGEFDFGEILLLQGDAEWQLIRSSKLVDRQAIDGHDAVLLSQFIRSLRQLDECQRSAADVVPDGIVDAEDETALLEWLVFIIHPSNQTSQWAFEPAPTDAPPFDQAHVLRVHFQATLRGDVDRSWPRSTR